MPEAFKPDFAATAPDRFVRRVVTTVGIVALAYIAWQVRAVTIILFGGILIATLLSAVAGWIVRAFSLPHRVGVAIAVVTILLFLGLTGWWVGDSVLRQFQDLREQFPRALDVFQQWLQGIPTGSAIAAELEGTGEKEIPWGRVVGFTGTALGALANVILILMIGLYLAATPDLYQRGLVRLVPPVYRKRTEGALSAAAAGLRSWLLGQLFTMAAIGVLATIGLYLLDIPLALPLGIIAGLLEFVPFIGPIIFSALAILLAFSEGPMAALYVALLTLGIQQLEGNVLTPMIQKRTVSLPPALGLVSVVIFSVLFGLPGILFATPLMVVVMILVKKLYVEGALEGNDQTQGVSRETPVP